MRCFWTADAGWIQRPGTRARWMASNDPSALTTRSSRVGHDATAQDARGRGWDIGDGRSLADPQPGGIRQPAGTGEVGDTGPACTGGPPRRFRWLWSRCGSGASDRVASRPASGCRAGFLRLVHVPRAGAEGPCRPMTCRVRLRTVPRHRNCPRRGSCCVRGDRAIIKLT